MLGLIGTPGQIWLSVAPVDLRRGIDGLSALVQQTLGQQPCAGSALVFRNAAGTRIKVLRWDSNGVWLCQRRLHQKDPQFMASTLFLKSVKRVMALTVIMTLCLLAYAALVIPYSQGLARSERDVPESTRSACG